MAIRVELKSESATSSDLAHVRVYDNEQLVAEVIAKIELEQGADGGYYSCVKLEKK